MKVAVFGSAFNPPTYSHMKIIELIMDKFDQVLVIPCYSHNFGKKMLPFEDRLEMAKLLINHLPKKVIISDIEKDLFKDSISRTYPLLKKLKEKNPENDYVFVCGFDNAEESNWEKFYNYELIDKEFGKYVIYENVGDTRSTMIRNKLVKGEDISGLTKPEIIKYINDNQIKFDIM